MVNKTHHDLSGSSYAQCLLNSVSTHWLDETLIPSFHSWWWSSGWPVHLFPGWHLQFANQQMGCYSWSVIHSLLVKRWGGSQMAQSMALGKRAEGGWVLFLGTITLLQLYLFLICQHSVLHGRALLSFTSHELLICHPRVGKDLFYLINVLAFAITASVLLIIVFLIFPPTDYMYILERKRDQSKSLRILWFFRHIWLVETGSPSGWHRWRQFYIGYV